MSKKISCFTVNKLMSAVSGHVRSSSANAAGVGNPSPSPKRRAKPPNRREQARRLQEQRRLQQGDEDADEWDWELAGNYGSPSKKSHVSSESSQSMCTARRQPSEIWEEINAANFVWPVSRF